MGKILVCVGDNLHSKVALQFATRSAMTQGLHLEVLHVIEQTNVEQLLALSDELRRDKEIQAQKYLDECASWVQEWGGDVPGFSIREGIISEEILKAIEEDHDISLLVLGISSESPSKDSLVPVLVGHMGKTMQIPLLIIPGNLTEQQIEELTH